MSLNTKEFITEEEQKVMKAFGTGVHKRIPHLNGVQRWMDNESRVEFTDAVLTSYNAELTINNDDNHKIWYSQLQGFYFCTEPNGENCMQGTLNLKDGKQYAFNSINPEEFWNLIKGMQFEVQSLSGFSKIDEKSTKVQDLETYGRVISHIQTAIKQKDWESMYGMLKSAPLYSLIEI